MTKTFRGDDGEGQGEREWRALTLLARYAPGLAPHPLHADLAREGPVVVMSRLPGVPLRGAALGPAQVVALGEAVRTLHAAVPATALDGIPPRPDRQEVLVEKVRRWVPATRDGLGARVRATVDAAVEWLARSGLETGDVAHVRRVFGAGDGNLANYVWDGERVRIVDFEDSGRSDRAFELAEMTEHVAGWVEHPLDVRLFLAQFDLSAAEAARLAEYRRLLALVWLLLLAADAAQRNPRNPPGTVERQAERLSVLLDG